MSRYTAYYITSAGGGPTTYNQSASGTLTSSGSLAKQAQKILAGTIASVGALLKLTQKSYTGSVACAGAWLGQSQKVLGGTVASAGALNKLTSRLFAGGLTPSAGLTGAKVALISLAGTLTGAGGLVKQAGKQLYGYLQTTLVSDAFTDSDSTLVSAHTIGPVNEIGAAWTNNTGANAISGNRVASFSGSTRTNHSTFDGKSPNGILTARVTYSTIAGIAIGVIARYVNDVAYWRIELNGGQLLIFEVNGTTTTRAFTNVSLADGQTYVLRAVFNGNTISATLDGASEISYSSASFNNAVTRHGIRVVTGIGQAAGLLAVDDLTWSAPSLSGSLSRQVNKVLSGEVNPAGALAKLTAKAFSGVLSFIGSLISAIVTVSLPPAARTYTPPSDSRSYAPMAESRVYTPPTDPDYTPPEG